MALPGLVGTALVEQSDDACFRCMNKFAAQVEIVHVARTQNNTCIIVYKFVPLEGLIYQN